jgi:hypothetical protein
MRHFTRLYICTLVLFFFSFFVASAALAKANLDPKAIVTVTHDGAKYIVAPDDQRANQWYYVPSLATLKITNGKPSLRLIKYQTKDKKTNDLVSGAMLRFQVTLSLSPKTENVLRAAIAKKAKISPKQFVLSRISTVVSKLTLFNKSEAKLAVAAPQNGIGSGKNTAELGFAITLPMSESTYKEIIQGQKGLRASIDFSFPAIVPGKGPITHKATATGYIGLGSFSEKIRKERVTIMPAGNWTYFFVLLPSAAKLDGFSGRASVQTVFLQGSKQIKGVNAELAAYDSNDGFWSDRKGNRITAILFPMQAMTSYLEKKNSKAPLTIKNTFVLRGTGATTFNLKETVVWPFTLALDQIPVAMPESPFNMMFVHNHATYNSKNKASGLRKVQLKVGRSRFNLSKPSAIPLPFFATSKAANRIDVQYIAKVGGKKTFKHEANGKDMKSFPFGLYLEDMVDASGKPLWVEARRATAKKPVPDKAGPRKPSGKTPEDPVLGELRKKIDLMKKKIAKDSAELKKMEASYKKIGGK